ncbi:hypothetical protein SDC9_205597 [bioreactor metagenome]|uniref:Uncharacterized protein n=1 Tax=bioreactor metagenome TaxID=1076179 RepID=A0A645J2T3_9ZZZZ
MGGVALFGHQQGIRAMAMFTEQYHEPLGNNAGNPLTQPDVGHELCACAIACEA